MISAMNLNKALLAVSLLPSVAARVYCNYYGCWSDLGWNCDWPNDVCGDAFSGYYCCDDDYWYGTGWGIAVLCIVGILVLVGVTWCIIAACSTPSRGQVIEPMPMQPVQTVPGSTIVVGGAQGQPATTITSGQATVVPAGNYSVQGQPVAAYQGEPVAVQGQPVVGEAVQV